MPREEDEGHLESFRLQRWMVTSGGLHPALARFGDSETGRKGAPDSGHRKVPCGKTALPQPGSAVSPRLPVLWTSGNGKDVDSVRPGREVWAVGVRDQLDGVQRQVLEERGKRRAGALGNPL